MKQLVRLSATIYLLLLSVNGVAVDVIGTESGIEFHAIDDYRALIVERMSSTQNAPPTPTMNQENIKAALIERLNGEYPLDPTPLVAQAIDRFTIQRLEAPMPGAWCVIGHDAESINWLKRYAPAFNERGVRGCFLINAADPAGFELMQAITPVPLYRVNGHTLWQIQALSTYPIVLVGKTYRAPGLK